MKNLQAFVWIFFFFGSVTSLFYAKKWYPQVFPSIDLSLQMDRKLALTSAEALAKSYQWGPSSHHQVASFSNDTQSQAFIELSPGGKTAFKQIVKEGLFSPYTWQVRHFQEGSAHELWISFNPQGSFYSFKEIIPENAPGAALSSEQALQIAKTQTEKLSPLSLEKDYELVEKAQEKKRHGRIDHTFTYERKNLPHRQEDLGEGKYRLRLTVSGDRLSELTPFIKIPDTFGRTYSEMRSKNNLLSQIALIAILILYGVLGCGIALFFLIKEKKLLPKAALVAAAWVTSFELLEGLNQYPLLWVGYPTTSSRMEFIFEWLTSLISQSLMNILILALTFGVAEGLTRKAFPRHPQLWKVWSPSLVGSSEIFKRTIGGYLGFGFFSLLILAIYHVGQKYMNWWSPSDLVFHPDSLATYAPGWTAIAHSLHAGLWEECLFRALPLASAMLLGKFFFKKRPWAFYLWMSAAMVFQALLFGAAHANYPTQPYYARLIELILPSLLFGGIYLRWGLLPGILIHFLFDVTAFSLPLFQAKTKGIELHQGMVVFLAFIPLALSLWNRILNRKNSSVPFLVWNETWKPSSHAGFQWNSFKEEKPLFSFRTLHQKRILFLGVFAFVGTFLFELKKEREAPQKPLFLSKKEAVSLAEKAIFQEGLEQPSSPEWTLYATASTEQGASHQLIWEEEGKQAYKALLGSYLAPPAWKLRWIKWEEEVKKRGEEYRLWVSGAGVVTGFSHSVPQDIGKKLGQPTEQEARIFALKQIQEKWNLSATDLKEVSVQNTQQSDQIDWQVEVAPQDLSLHSGEARIRIHQNGKKLGAYSRFVHIPEEWLRKQAQKNLLFFSLYPLGLTGWISLGMIFLLFGLLSWTQGRFHLKAFLWTSGVLFISQCLSIWNQSPEWMASFSAIHPPAQQLFSQLLHRGSISLIVALVLAIGWGMISFQIQNSPLEKKSEKRTGLMLGLGTGLFSSALLGLIQFISQSLPFTGSAEALNLKIPLFLFLNHLPLYFGKILFLFFVSKSLRVLEASRMLSVCFLLVISTSTSVLFSHNLTEFGLLGVALTVLLRWISRTVPDSGLPWIPFCSLLFQNSLQLIQSSFPATVLPIVLETFFFGCLSLWLSRTLSPPKKSSPFNPLFL